MKFTGNAQRRLLAAAGVVCLATTNVVAAAGDATPWGRHPLRRHVDNMRRPANDLVARAAPNKEEISHDEISHNKVTPDNNMEVLQPAPLNPPVEFFQVGQPVLNTGGSSSCEVVLMVHSFANSFNEPFVGDYVPPDCEFDHVVIDFGVQIRGRQYDRTGVLYFNDTELWRTTTAEPRKSGIYWHWTTLMTPYLSLWQQPQKVIFDLPNGINVNETGVFNTTLTATFFKNEDVQVGHHAPADLIIPISTRNGTATGAPTQFVYPQDTASNTISFPRNANRAVFTVDAKAQADDEFWFNNVPESAVWTFNETYDKLPGYSAWREIQVLIDGKLAGVSWPFPTIFTGGVLPILHRPVVGIDVFEMKEHEIDITPWLPLLCDGNQHTFTIQVVGIVDDPDNKTLAISKTVENYWYLTGKIFVWLDSEGSITTGTTPSISGQGPNVQLSYSVGIDSNGTNETLTYSVDVTRTYSLSAFIKTEKARGRATWSQSLTFSNQGTIYGYGYNSTVNSHTSGNDSSSGPTSPSSYSTTYVYPLICTGNMTFNDDGSTDLSALIDQSLVRQVGGAAVFPTGEEAYENATSQYRGARVETHFLAQGDMLILANDTHLPGNWTQSQTFDLYGLVQGSTDDAGVQLYDRHVETAQGNLTFDSRA